MSDSCLFCKIAAGQIPSNQVYSDQEFYAFRDISPVAPTHILIVPRKHIERITDASADDAALIGRMMLKANEIAEAEGIVKQGCRYVINTNEGAGQSVFHIHLHILGGRPMAWPPG